jgi:hypothetical protein
MALLDGQTWERPRRAVAVKAITLFDVVLAVLAAVAVLGLARAAAAIGSPHPYGNEGWNAFHAASAMAGLGPYPPAGSFLTNNYPPLSFYIVGAAGQLIGDNILAGRLISLMSFLVIAAAMAAAARALRCTVRQSAFAVLIFTSFLLFESDYVGINDPQLLAQALQMSGLVVLLRAGGRAKTLALAVALMTASVFTKHNLIALPAAAGLWLIATDRKSGLTFAGYGIAFAVAGLALFDLAVGRSLWSVLASPRVWSLAYALSGFGGRLPYLVLPVAATAVLAIRHGDAPVKFAALYLALSLGLAFWFFGGAGCSGNVLFDGFIALALCGGLAAQRFQGRGRTAAQLCFFVSIAGMLVFHIATNSFKPRYWLTPNAPAVTDAVRDVAFLKTQAGPVLVKDLALAYWAEKPASVDVWSYEQAVTTGARDGHELVAAIAARRFAVLQLGAPPNAADAPPEIRSDYVQALNAAITANYRIDHRDANGTFWVPKR